MKKREILAFSIILLGGALLRLLNLQYFHGLDTDEAIYAQIVFAMTRGQTLYRTVGFVHPPIYPVLEYPLVMISPTLWTIRFFNVMLGIAIVCLVFFLCKIIYTLKVAFLASTIYAFYPLAIYSNKLALIENSLTFFVTLTFLLFAKYVKEKKLKYLYLSGLFAGISFMTKYTALFFIAAIVFFATLRVFRKKIGLLMLFIASTAVIPSVIVILFLASGLWPFFYMEAISWQLIRFGMPLSEKFWFFGLIIASLSPLILVAILNFRRNLKDWRGEMLMSWFFVPLAFLVFSRIVFLHYGFSLILPIAILGALSIDRYVPSKFGRQTFSLKVARRIVGVLLVVILVLTIIGRFADVLYGIEWFFVENVSGTQMQSEYAQAQMNVTDYIMKVTNANDKIWSSDASFGFLSQRLLVPPDSEYWKFQGFFQDVWGYGWSPVDYRGPIPGYPTGLYTLQDILEGWKKEEPRVILMIRTSWVDYFVWNGINNTYHQEAGLGNYITSNYYLDSKFYNQTIEIWIRNTSIEQYSQRTCPCEETRMDTTLSIPHQSQLVYIKTGRNTEARSTRKIHFGSLTALLNFQNIIYVEGRMQF